MDLWYFFILNRLLFGLVKLGLATAYMSKIAKTEYQMKRSRKRKG